MSNRRDDDTLPAAVPVSAIFVGGVAARNLAAGGEPRPAKALARAAAMRSAGASADAIHAETSRMLAGTPYAGVHYGVDGKPRFEISDEGARVRPAALDKSGRGFVGDFLAHGDLYKALPEAQLLGLEKAKFSGGGYDGQTVHVGRNHFADKMLAGRHMERQSARGVVLHELQHYAQDVEGFAPGASPDDFRRQFPNNEAMRVKLYETTAGEVEAENTRARRNYTAAQRRETAPSKTTTVPVSEQHLGHHEGGMARQFGGDLPKGYSVKRHTNSIGQTNYDIYVRGRFFGKQKVGNAYVRDLGDRVQVGRISIDEPHQRKGIATALYAQIERDLGKKVVPDDTLSAKAAAFWRKHRPEALASHRELGDGSLMIDPYGMFKTEYADPATGGARTGEVRRIQRMVDKPSAGSKPRKGDIIEDFGEKIGGARKDTAKAPRRTTAGKPSGPAYERQFVAMESRHRPGEWYLFKAPSGRGRYGGIVSKRVGGPFPSEAVANAAKPLAAVSTTHAVMGVSGGGYGIKRHTTKGYIPAAGGQTFPTRDEALAYMAQHVEDLLQAKTPKGFGEALLREVKVTHTERIGPKVASGDVSPDQFMKTFAPRGVEFGNWEDGARRGKLLTASYEALHDLSRVLEVDPSGLTMGGKLGLSFGARGTGGVNAGSATYHPDYGTMNFTKPHGSGALAHEYMHALDHLLGRLDDPALDQKVTNSRGDQVWKTAQEASFATNRVAWYARQQTLNAEVRTALADLMKTMTAKTVSEVEPVEPLQRSADRAMTEARNILEQTRRGLTETVSYRSRHNKPATAEQLAAFDKHAAALLAGEGGAVPYKSVSLGRRSPNDVPFEHPHLRGISEVMRQVRGKSGFGDYYGSLDSVAQNMRAAQDIQKRLAAAAASVGRERTAPTDFLRNARKLDQTRTSPYWTERHEMFARAGEAWIHDKLTARGEASPYLVAGSKNTFEAAKAAILGGMDDTPKPFPEGAERVAINAKFENLFSAMKRAGILPGMAVTAEPSGTGAPRAAAPAPETSGLRGTQNPANLAAIVENRQANAQGEQPAPAKPKASADGAVKPGSVTPSVTSVTKATGKTVADQGTVAPSVTRAAPSRDVTIGDNGGPSEQALKTAARLEDVAKRTIEKAEAEANRPRLMNTARRARMGGGGKVTASVKFEYDPERVQRFKAAFPTAKFNPTTKEWTVAGVTAQKRIDKWQAIDADATAKAALAEAKARDALAFDKPKVQHPWVTQGKSGYAIKTPYDPDLVKAIKSLPGARWDATAKTWNVPLRSVDALAAKLPEIDRIASASKTIAADAARRQTLEAERKASEAKWEKLNADRQAQWAKETAARQAQKSAQVHKPRSIVLAERAPEVGTAVRLGNKVLTVEGLGKIYRADENTSSVGGPIGAEGERVRNVYYRDPTAAEVAALETREAAAKAAAQAQKVKADALHAMREAFREKGQMPAKMDQIPKGATVLQSGSQNSRLYGGGEDYVLRGKTLYQVIGNSADGDDWSVSNAPGSIVKQVPVTPDLLARMRAAADRPAKGVGPQALSGKIGFQNEANLNAALEAQGKAAAGKANPAARADARTEFMAAAKTVKLPGGGFEVTAPDGTKIAMPNAGTEAAAKITAFAKIGAAVNKLGAISMIAAPTAAAYVAYHATKDQANAAGRDGTAEAVGQAAVAGGTVAGIGYAAMKTLGGAMKLAAKVAPKIAPALGPAGVALGVGMTGYAAYQGYKRHGAKGALAATVGVDVLLDAKPPAAAAQQPVQGRLSDAQQQQFATANAAYAAMKTRTEQAADGMTKSYTRHVNGQPVKVRAYKTPQR